jgi:hypothetical protein
MQNAITMEDSYRGVTQEERVLLCQLFDKMIKETFGTSEPARELSSNQGENDDIIN